MAVVINEFEVIPGEPAPAEPTASPSPGAQESDRPPSTHEIERVLEQQWERAMRVWAQ